MHQVHYKAMLIRFEMYHSIWGASQEQVHLALLGMSVLVPTGGEYINTCMQGCGLTNCTTCVTMFGLAEIGIRMAFLSNITPFPPFPSPCTGMTEACFRKAYYREVQSSMAMPS